MAKKGTLTVRIVGDEKSFTGALRGAQKSAEGFASKLPGILGAAGAAAGGALAFGLLEAFEREAATDKLAAALNLSDGEAEAAGRIAGEVWADAFGDNIGEVNTAIEGVASTLGSFGELGEEAIGDLTRDALTIADVFNMEVSEAIEAAGILLNTGLVKDADEAFDLITRGLQEMPSALRGELLEASNEYGKFFDQLGIDGTEAFALLVEAADMGQYAIDKTGDAIGEFTKLAVDGSASTEEAFATIGLNADEMANKILAGGDTAREAFGIIVEELLAIEDPAEQARVAVALFGTPLEDLRTSDIPLFLEALATMEGGLDDVAGATDRTGDAAYDNMKTRWTAIFRDAQQAFLTFADENLLPKIDEIVRVMEEEGLAEAWELVKDEWQEAWPQIEGWLYDTVAPAMVEFGKEVGKQMGKALWAGFWAAIKSPFEDFAESWSNLFDVEMPTLPGSASSYSRPSASVPNRRRTAEPPNRTRTPTTNRSRAGNTLFMHDGGIVPGRPGTNVPIVARPGEEIIPVGGERQSRGPTMVVNQTFNTDVTRTTLAEARHQQRLAFLEAV